MSNGEFFTFGQPESRSPEQILLDRKNRVTRFGDAIEHLEKAKLALREVYALSIESSRLLRARKDVAVVIDYLQNELRKELGGS